MKRIYHESEDAIFEDNGEEEQNGKGLCCSLENTDKAEHGLRPLPDIWIRIATARWP